MKPIRAIPTYKVQIISEFSSCKRSVFRKILAKQGCMTRADAARNLGMSRTTLNEWVLRLLNVDDFFRESMAVKRQFADHPNARILQRSLNYYMVWAISVGQEFFGNIQGNRKLKKEEMIQQVMAHSHLFTLNAYRDDLIRSRKKTGA